MKTVDYKGHIKYYNNKRKISRIGMPACILGLVNLGNLRLYKQWVYNGKFHRMNGKVHSDVYTIRKLYGYEMFLNTDKLVI